LGAAPRFPSATPHATGGAGPRPAGAPPPPGGSPGRTRHGCQGETGPAWVIQLVPRVEAEPTRRPRPAPGVRPSTRKQLDQLPGDHPLARPARSCRARCLNALAPRLDAGPLPCRRARLRRCPDRDPGPGHDARFPPLSARAPGDWVGLPGPDHAPAGAEQYEPPSRGLTAAAAEPPRLRADAAPLQRRDLGEHRRHSVGRRGGGQGDRAGSLDAAGRPFETSVDCLSPIQWDTLDPRIRPAAPACAA
jgi:hypothetical protein